eukprot:scaffold27982_cov31-Tisochrysis_lutea.AAC.5
MIGSSDGHGLCDAYQRRSTRQGDAGRMPQPLIMSATGRTDSRALATTRLQVSRRKKSGLGGTHTQDRSKHIVNFRTAKMPQRKG